MYYQTIIQRICTGGGAIDVQGKKLSFMGNLPVQAGDVVWTDGNVIFGHVQAENTPLIPISNVVVPVLDNDTLRGYFKLNGTYKDYEIVDDSWIVNNKSKFEHGATLEVIDAEIVTNEEGTSLYTAEVVDSGIYSLKKNNEEYESIHLGAFNQATNKIIDFFSLEEGDPAFDTFEVLTEMTNFKFDTDGEYEALITSTAHANIIGEEKIIDRQYSKQEFQNINFPFDLTDDGYEKFREDLKIKIENNETDTTEVSVSVAGGSDTTTIDTTINSDTLLNMATYYEKDENLKEAIALFWSYCLDDDITTYNLEIDLNNELDSSTSVSASAKCMIHIKSNDESAEVVQELFAPGTFTYKEIDVWEHIDGFYYNAGLNSFPMTKGYNDEYVDQAANTYGVANPIYVEYMNNIAADLRKHVGYVIFIHEDDRKEHFDEYKFEDDHQYFDGTHLVHLRVTGYKKEKIVPFYAMYIKKIPVTVVDVYQGGFAYAEWKEDTKSCMYVFFANTPGEEFNTIYPVDDMLTTIFQVPTQHGDIPVWLLKDNKYLYLKTQTSANCKDFKFPVQDDYYVEYTCDEESEDEEYKWIMTGIYDSSDTQICGELPAQYDENGDTIPAETYNLCITPLRKTENQYLVGIHNCKLYKVEEENFEEVGDELKNFRLREIRNISKAKN